MTSVTRNIRPISVQVADILVTSYTKLGFFLCSTKAKGSVTAKLMDSSIMPTSICNLTNLLSGVVNNVIRC